MGGGKVWLSAKEHPQQGVSKVPSAGGGWVGRSPDPTAGSVITGDFGRPLVLVLHLTLAV